MVPEKTHYVADALSRAPLFEAAELSDITIDTARTCLTDTEIDQLEKILDSRGAEYRGLLTDVKTGSNNSPLTRQLHGLRNVLSTDGELVYMDACRIILPKKAVPLILPRLQRLHSSHSGLSKTYELARSLYYWSGMYNEVKQVIQRCSVCAKFGASQPHGPRSTQAPFSYYGPPMSQVGVDLFDFGGKAHLVCMDHWSGFPLFCELHSTTSKAICTALAQWFNVLGWPRHIRSDGGPQFRSEFTAFCSMNGIRHELAAPYNSRSNGLAESGVKICKLLLAKAAETREDPQ